MPFDAFQIATAAAAAALIGFSKTGVPGSGILVVPMMASVFGGRLSVGATLPLLIAADCFAVWFYRSDAEWDRIRRLAPWVVAGLFLGVWLLLALPGRSGARDPLSPIIGGIVLLMLALQLLRGRLGERFAPTSPAGTAATGALAGFTTMASNAAGPIMAIYMTAAKLPKRRFMGTTAWYFFTINLVKVPLLVAVTLATPREPLVTARSLQLDLLLLPLIAVGAISGCKLLPVIPEKAFTATILALAAIAALKLVVG